MIAGLDKYELRLSDVKRPKEQILLFLLFQFWLIGSIVLYLGFNLEYLFLINLGIISLVVIALLSFGAPYWITFCSVLLATLPRFRIVSIRLLDWVLLSLGLSLILTSLTYGKPKMNIKRIDLYIILYLCAIVISGCVSGRLINVHFVITVYAFLVFFATRSFIKTDSQLKGALFLLPVCGLLIVLQMASSFMRHHPQLITLSFSRMESNVSWGSTNYLAALLVLLLPFVLSLFFVVKGIIQKAFSLGLVAAMVVGVFWTVSRTGALCLFIILIMFLLSFNKRKALLFLVGLFIAYYFLTPFVGKVTTRFSSHDIGSYFSVLERYDLWQKSWKIFEENPMIGVGMGNAEVVTVFKNKVTNPHNIIFKSLADTGIVGFTLLVLIFGELFKTLFEFKKIIKATNTDRTIYIGFLVTLSVSIFNRMFEVIGDRYEIIFWFIMGLLFLTVEYKTSNPYFILFGSKK